MKKLLAMVMAIMLVAMCAVVGVTADTADATCNVNKVDAKQGDEVTFTATLAGAVTVKSGSVSLSYDKTVLELVSGKWNVEDTTLASFNKSKEQGAFAYEENTEISGTVFTATFKVLDSAAYGTTDVDLKIGLKIMDADEDEVSLNVTNNKGSVTLKRELLPSYFTVELSAPETWTAAGDELVVKATVTNTSDDALATVNFLVNYDKSKVAAVLPGFDASGSVSGAWGNNHALVYAFDDDTVSCFGLVESEDAVINKGESVEFTLKFKVLDAADGAIDFTVSGKDEGELWAGWLLDPEMTVLPGTAGAKVTVDKYVAPVDPSTPESSDPSVEPSTPESSAPAAPWTPNYKDVDENGAWGAWITPAKPAEGDIFDFQYAIEKIGTDINVAIKYYGEIASVAADAASANGTGTNFRAWFAADDGTAWGALCDVYNNGTEWKANFRTNGGETVAVPVEATEFDGGVEVKFVIAESALGFAGGYKSFVAVSTLDSEGVNHCLNSNNAENAGSNIEAYASGTVNFKVGTEELGDSSIYVIVGLALVVLIGTAVVIRKRA